MKFQTLLITTFAIAFANAQDKGADPFVAGKDSAQADAQSQNEAEARAQELAIDADGKPIISICYEDFSLPLAQAAALQREGLTDAAFYAAILAAVSKDSAHQESFVILRASSGYKATNEGISEMIYPTEYEAAQLSNAVTTGVPGTDKDGKPTPAGSLPVPGPVSIARTPATPTAFETRNLGFSLEIEPTLSGSKKSIDLRLVPEHVNFVGRTSWGQELSTTESPNFEAQRINTAVLVRLDEPFLLGTISRPPVSSKDPSSANRVWFAFVTAKLTK